MAPTSSALACPTNAPLDKICESPSSGDSIRGMRHGVTSLCRSRTKRDQQIMDDDRQRIFMTKRGGEKRGRLELVLVRLYDDKKECFYSRVLLDAERPCTRFRLLALLEYATVNYRICNIGDFKAGYCKWS